MATTIGIEPITFGFANQRSNPIELRGQNGGECHLTSGDLTGVDRLLLTSELIPLTKSIEKRNHPHGS
jgi:hypothetical protein